jgi:hypothetical protein
MARQPSLAELLPGLPPFYAGSAPSSSKTASTSAPTPAPLRSQQSLADVLPGLALAMPAYVLGGNAKAPVSGSSGALSSSSQPVIGSSVASAPKFAPPSDFGDLAFVAARVMADNEGPPIPPRTLKVAVLLVGITG